MLLTPCLTRPAPWGGTTSTTSNASIDARAHGIARTFTGNYNGGPAAAATTTTPMNENRHDAIHLAAVESSDTNQLDHNIMSLKWAIAI